MKKQLMGLWMSVTVLFALISFTTLAQAADVAETPSTDGTQTVNITLHKLLFDEGKTPTAASNDGLSQPAYSAQATPLKGAEFTMYDVTTVYNKLLNDGKSAKEAVAALQADASNQQTTKLAIMTTGTDGSAMFSSVKISDGSQYKAYLFVETKVPSGATDKATPLVITMPVYNNGIAFLNKNTSGTNSLSTINLYPKNEAKTAVTKTMTGTTTSYTVGEKVPYQVTLNIPATADSSYQVTDTPSTGLQVLLDDTFVVKVDGATVLKATTDYTVTKNTNNGGYTLKLTNPTSWVGRQLTIAYNMQVTADATMDNGLVNNVKVQTNTTSTTTPTTPATSVFTGGYHFVKQDANSKAGIAGAEFQVKDSAGNVLSFVKNTNNEWVADATGQATGATQTIVTQDEGKLVVSGLKAGDYTLTETKAATGYVLPAKPTTSFTVVTNEKGTASYTATKATPVVITNVKQGILPSTGGTGIIAFLLIGLALMIGALVWYKKHNQRVEEI